MIGPASRIIARYLASLLVTAGYLLPEEARVLAMDPDVLMIIGMILGGGTEMAYGFARKKGWKL